MKPNEMSGSISQVHTLMDELEVLLEEKVQEAEIRELLDQYRDLGGASAEGLNAFEQEFGVRLPADFRAFYERKNGSGYALHVLYPGDEEAGEWTPFYLMSLEEMRDGMRMISGENQRLDEFYSAEEIGKLDPEIRPYLFHQSRVPFATIAGGSLYLMLDFDPTEQGTYGQVIVYVHDPDFVYYVAPTFTQMLEQSNRNLSTMEEIDY